MFIFAKIQTNYSMTLIKSGKGKSPVFGDNVCLAENATIVREITMDNNCSV